MFRVSRSAACSLLILCFASFGAMPALAADPMIALDGKTRSAIADKSEFTSKDAATHESLEVNLRGKTLDTIKPGDIVDLNGKEYTLTSIAEELEIDAELAGLGFAIGAIMKFKQHKDNPTQRP